MKAYYRRLGTLLVLLGLCGGAAHAGLVRAAGPQPLAASGVVRVEEVRLASEMHGEVREILVREGEAVRQGQVVARLANTALAGQLEQAAAAARAAEADLVLAQSHARTEAISAAQAQVALAEAQLAGAQAQGESARQALRDPQEWRGRLLEATTRAAMAAQSVEAAHADYQRAIFERDKLGFGSPQRYTQSLVVVAQEAGWGAAQADYAAAQVAVARLGEILAHPVALEVQVRRANSDVAVAQAGVQVARLRLADLLAGPQRGETDLAEAKLTLAREQAALVRAQAERLVLVAPRDSIVLDQVAEVGEMATPGTPLLILGDLERAKVTVFVPEPSLSQVRLGQTAWVSVDGFPGRTWGGTVTRIADHLEYTPRNIATQEGRQNTYFAVEVTVDNEELVLKPGMPADVSLQ